MTEQSTMTISSHGAKVWKLPNGHLHRISMPAIEHLDGSKEWWIDGQYHREDGPAIEWSNGHKEWWVNGNKHREDGPAIEYADGSKAWWIEGKFIYMEEND